MAQLGPDGLVVNVGAGTGSYEPADRTVVAVEPSLVMMAQRRPGAGPAVRASASALPLPSGVADVALAVLTVHHWDDWETGLAELCRVALRHVWWWRSTSSLTHASGSTRSTSPRSAQTPDSSVPTPRRSPMRSAPRSARFSPCRRTCGTACSGPAPAPARGIPRPGGPGQLLRAGTGRPGRRRPRGGRAGDRPAPGVLAPPSRRAGRARLDRPRVPAAGQRREGDRLITIGRPTVPGAPSSN